MTVERITKPVKQREMQTTLHGCGDSGAVWCAAWGEGAPFPLPQASEETIMAAVGGEGTFVLIFREEDGNGTSWHGRI